MSAQGRTGSCSPPAEPACQGTSSDQGASPLAVKLAELLLLTIAGGAAGLVVGYIVAVASGLAPLSP